MLVGNPRPVSRPHHDHDVSECEWLFFTCLHWYLGVSRVVLDVYCYILNVRGHPFTCMGVGYGCSLCVISSFDLIVFSAMCLSTHSQFVFAVNGQACYTCTVEFSYLEVHGNNATIVLGD